MRRLQTVYRVQSDIWIGGEKKCLSARWHLIQPDSTESRCEVVRQIEAQAGGALIKPEIEVSGMIPAEWQEENKLSLCNPLPSARAKVVVTFEAPLSELKSLQEFEMRLDEELQSIGVGFVDGNEIERSGDRVVLEVFCYGPRKAPLKEEVERQLAAAGLQPRKIR